MATSAANPTRTPSGLLTFLGGIVLLAIFAAIVVFWISGRAPGDAIEAKRAAGRVQTRETLNKEAAEKLHSDGWIDKSKGIARITIGDAVKLTINDLRNKQVVPSSLKVEPPLPVPVQDPNSTEPPAPRLPSAPQGADNFPFQAPNAVRPMDAPGGPAAPATVPAQPAPAQPAAPTAPAPEPAPTAPTQPAPAQPAAPAAPAPQPAPAAPTQPAPAQPAAPAPQPAPAAPMPEQPAPVQPAAPATPAPQPAPAAPTPEQPAPAQPAAPAAPAPQPTPAAPTPEQPAPAQPATPAAPAPQAAPAAPAPEPAQPQPAPAQPAVPAAPAPQPASEVSALSANAAINRPPLINWTETK